MKVYKFGGASVKDGDGVRNVTSIVRNANSQLIVVISAMGKMTNAFEVLNDAWFNKDEAKIQEALVPIKNYHEEIVKDLFGSAQASVRYNEFISQLENRLCGVSSMHFDYEYDQVVSYGELLSTAIIADYWESQGLDCCWQDVRNLLKTDDLYRDANVDWELTTK